MALVLANRVQQTGTANTTVSFTLSGSVTGYQSFAVIGNTNTTYYSATDTSGNWEVGLGTYSTTGPTLTRTTVYASSNAGAAVTFSGTVTVFVTYPSGRSVNLDASGNVSALGTVASGTWQGSTVGVAYGGTGVTASSGANSVMLRDANQNVSINRLNQANTSVTAAAGTTTLTAASSYSQTLTGTGGQTFKMPDATTLTTGVAYIFNNNATGTLTLQDNALATIGTVTPGGACELVLLANGTVGGTWDVHGFLPENVTWGTNALALGSTVITGGTWNGGTIGTAYGGTNLTTFTGANNAIYSTSASVLAAGTLPVAAGGTGVTTIPTNGQLLIGNGTNYTVATLGSGTGISTTTGAGTLTINNTGVTSFSAGTTGLTPSTGTTGAVTLAGTLAVANGGSGATTAQGAMNTFAGAVTSGSYLRGNGTNVVMSTIQAADVPTLNQNTTGTAANVTGVVAVANGGTGLTTAPTNGQIDIGSTGVGFVRTTLSAGTGITITNGAGSINIASSVTPVTSVTGTAPVSSSGGTTPAISLASGYGDTQNPYASKTANFFLAAPNGIAGVPTFRAVVAADIPTLNQNTTGSAGSVTNAVTFNNGGAGAASGTTYNGSAAQTISYNTVGASPLAGSSSITTVGTIGTGTWQGSVINSTYGGTGVNNAGRTFTVNTNSGTISYTLAATTLTVANNASVSGTNTGDQTITLTGDVTGSGTGSFATTLATVNSNVGSFGSGSLVPVITVNGKGLITAVSTAAVSAATATSATYASSGTQSSGGVVHENPQTLSSNYTMTTNYNGMSAGPITVSTGVTVTIPTGSVWTVV